MRAAAVDLVRPLARRTVLAATAASVILALAAPLVLYVRTRRIADLLAEQAAERMALLARDVVAEVPDLWFYAAPKFARYLHLEDEAPLVRQVVIVDRAGRRLDLPEGRPSRGAVWWADAPVYHGDAVVARVWVGVDGTRLLAQVLVVAVLCLVLAVVLSTALYVLPVRVVAEAEDHIGTLIDTLERARAELAALNADLEGRVAERSRELADAAAALGESEARLRDIASRAAEATEQERKRVARELHDGAGQVLTGIRLGLQVLGTTLGPDSPARGRLESTEALVDGAIEEVRRIAMALRPAALDRLGLVESLEELARSVASRAGLEIEFDAPALPERLPAAVESAAYRLVQECLTNVVRYADASKARVSVTLRDEQIDISVHDEGKGFDPRAPRTGLGLDGMAERVALLGGRLAIDSAVGRGTRVTATLPIEPPSARPEAADGGKDVP